MNENTKNAQERVELHLHTVYSSMDALTRVDEAIKKAVACGHPAVAITDFGNIQAFPEAYRAAKRYGIKVIYGIECECFNDRPQDCFRVMLLVKNNIGKKNLYKLMSNYKDQRLCINKQVLAEHREGLLIGAVGFKGEPFKAAVNSNGLVLSDNRKLAEIAGFYDYIEILPTLESMMISDRRLDRREQQKYNAQTVQIAKAAGKPFVAAGNVHFLDPEDEICKKVLLSVKGADTNVDIPLYFRRTVEMLAEFSYLGEADAQSAVVNNTRMIADCIDDDIIPVDGSTGIPLLDGSDKRVRDTCITRAVEIYGSSLPQPVQALLDWELDAIEKNGYSSLYMIAEQLVKRSRRVGYPVGSRGCIASSFAAFLLGITEINPLPPHYVCPECKHSIFPVDGKYDNGFDMPDVHCPQCGAEMRKDGFHLSPETLLGLDGEKVPDIDFNFSGEYQGSAVKHLKEILGDTHVFQAGIVQAISERLAYAYTERYSKDHELNLPEDELSHIAEKIIGVKRGDGQSPGGYFMVPSNADALDYFPICINEGDYYTHFPAFELYGHFLKLDLLGHDTPTILKDLQHTTGIVASDIPLDDQMTLKTLVSCDTIGLPEFGSSFARRMIEKAKPSCLADFFKISGLMHSSGAWDNNAEDLIENGTATFSEVIALRDDVMQHLMEKGVDRTDAFQYAHLVRMGRIYAHSDKSNKDWASLLKAKGVEDWFLESAAKIMYLFPKAHAAVYTVQSFQLAWYKTHYPCCFYAVMLNHMDQFNALTAADFEKNSADISRELETILEGTDDEDYSDDRTKALELLVDMYKHGCYFVPLYEYEQDADGKHFKAGAKSAIRTWYASQID